MEALCLWNLPAPRVYCCAFHLAVREAEDTIRRLRRRNCCEDFIGAVSGQCDRCGALAEVDPHNPDGGFCSLCGTLTLKAIRTVMTL